MDCFDLWYLDLLAIAIRYPVLLSFTYSFRFRCVFCPTFFCRYPAYTYLTTLILIGLTERSFSSLSYHFWDDNLILIYTPSLSPRVFHSRLNEDMDQLREQLKAKEDA